jgi:hypothetical protein
MTWSSTDTLELNSISERKFRTLGEIALAMLLRSGIPKAFWFDAYLAAVHITLRLPTRTYRGWMNPHECCPGGTVPSLGSKAYVLKPKADRRKDWEEKAQTGHFMEYSADKQGWTVWLPEYEKTVTSVHVLLDEQPPARPQEYYEEIDNPIVREVGPDPETRRLEDYLYLVSTHYTYEGFLYKTTRVLVRKGLIVGFRALITADRQQIEEQRSIYVKDIEEMMKQFISDSAMAVGQDADYMDHTALIGPSD